MTQYTIEDLAAAREALDLASSKWDNYTGNNPNKFSTARRRAMALVETIEGSLKRAGVVPYTPAEELERELDMAFPESRHKDIVEFRGRRFERRFTPGDRSRSGRVVSWNRSWLETTAPVPGEPSPVDE